MTCTGTSRTATSHIACLLTHIGGSSSSRSKPGCPSGEAHVVRSASICVMSGPSRDAVPPVLMPVSEIRKYATQVIHASIHGHLQGPEQRGPGLRHRNSGSAALHLHSLLDRRALALALY